MKILETERLLLRNQQPEDLDVIAKMFGDEEVMRFIGDGKTFTRSVESNQLQNGMTMNVSMVLQAGLLYGRTKIH